MGFDRVRFDDLLDEIETYLGYLRGNENAWAYLEQVFEANRHTPGLKPTNESIVLDEDYRFPCQDGRFRLQYKPLVGAIGIVEEGHWRGDYADYVKQVQQETDAAWHTGASWAAGIGGYARSICEQFVRPDVSTLTALMLSMKSDVVDKLNQAAYDDWVSLGRINDTWRGDANAAFNTFYDNFDNALTLFALFSGFVNTGVGFVTAVVAGTQAGAMDFVQDLHDNLETQLDMWARESMPPQDPAPTPAWIGDVLTFSKNLYGVIEGLLPPLDAAVEKVEDVAGKVDKAVEEVKSRVESAERLTGKKLLPDTQKRVPVKTAAEVYEHLTSTLKGDYLDKFHQSLDGVHSGGLSSGTINDRAFSGQRVVALMEDRIGPPDNWHLPDVPDKSLATTGDRY
jgi:hypothetical protein